MVIVDGWPVEVDVDSGWAEKGLSITVEHDREPGPGGDVSAEEERTLFDVLHEAFSPGTVTVQVPTGLTVGAPIVIVNHQASVDRATFPHVVVDAGDGSDVSVVERQTSVEGFGLSVPLVELRAHSQAMLVSGVAAFGARYARLRVDTRLVGRGATGNLSAAYYGDGDQVHDFRVFQHHDARDSRSDLLFKGAQDDASGSVYTGLIHIHPDGAGANAFQTNRNVKLSQDPGHGRCRISRSRTTTCDAATRRP